MLNSPIAGKRLIPFYHEDFALSSIGKESFIFEELPVFQIIHLATESSSGFSYVNQDTGASVSITPTDTSISVTGVNYDVKTFNPVTVAAGKYYFLLTYETKIYRSATITVQPCKSLFKLRYSNSCESVQLGSGITNTVNLENFYLAPTNFEEYREGIEDGNGKESHTYINRTAKYSIEIISNREFFERLGYLPLFDTITLETPTGTIIPIDQDSVEVSANGVNHNDFLVTVTFSLIDNAESENCNCDLYGEEEIDSPVSGCDDIIVSINTASFPTLGYTVTNPVAGSPIVSWKKNGVFLSKSATVTADSTPALYEVSVLYYGCSIKTASYEYINPCNAFKIEDITKNSGVIDANIVGADGDTVTISVLTGGSEVATSLPYDASGTPGVYTIIATNVTKGCTYRAAVVINSSDTLTCTHSVAINRVGNVLETIMSGVVGTPTITYSWTRIDESGNESGVIGTGSSIAPSIGALYKVSASIGGCAATATRIYLVEKLVTINGSLYYEQFSNALGNINSAVAYINVTKGALPDPAMYSDIQINELIQLTASTGVLTYEETPSDTVFYGIDIVNNRITFSSNVNINEIIHLRWRNAL